MIGASTPRRIGVVALVATIAAACAAWSWPRPAREVAAAEGAECRFAIRASNNLSFDVWVDLYDSTVHRTGLFVPSEQLKIQNHRIRSGATMDRRYTARGACKVRRTWLIRFRRGSAQQTVLLSTSGDSAAARIVDLGPSSRWGAD